ncbi:hypothetical protein E3N88_08491 [Mikania micrantha]|uniref:Uncharacterized protein n=1 Tax=Mikania micrantha TaxID=192012 RepID=A0A5N6PJG3_9ASTR|nr:hypothetical protein E3N88_08491 [Mikania micrantha]
MMIDSNNTKLTNKSDRRRRFTEFGTIGHVAWYAADERKAGYTSIKKLVKGPYLKDNNPEDAWENSWGKTRRRNYKKRTQEH